jgi:hypothetical protein
MPFGPNPFEFPVSVASYAALPGNQHRHATQGTVHSHPYGSVTGHPYGHSFGVHHSALRHTHPDANGVHNAPKLPAYDPATCCTGKFQADNEEFYAPLPAKYQPAMPSALKQMSQLDTHAGPNTEQTVQSKYYDSHSVSRGAQRAKTIRPRQVPMSDQEKRLRRPRAATTQTSIGFCRSGARRSSNSTARRASTSTS